MADFFTCKNSGIAFTAWMMNLIKSFTNIAGINFGGWMTAIYESGTPASPYVCTANDTLDSLLKRCIEVSTCCTDGGGANVGIFRLYVITPTECPDALPCTANPTLIFEGVKYTFVELTGVGLAMVLFNAKKMCDTRPV